MGKCLFLNSGIVRWAIEEFSILLLQKLAKLFIYTLESPEFFQVDALIFLLPYCPICQIL